jgi:chromate transport protein ChrA
MPENKLRSILKTFLIIRTTSLGGYIALIAMMRSNLVERDVSGMLGNSGNNYNA